MEKETEVMDKWIIWNTKVQGCVKLKMMLFLMLT